jgi:hypothetical protein
MFTPDVDVLLSDDGLGEGVPLSPHDVYRLQRERFVACLFRSDDRQHRLATVIAFAEPDQVSDEVLIAMDRTVTVHHRTTLEDACESVVIELATRAGALASDDPLDLLAVRGSL